MSLPKTGEIRVASWWNTCVGCGARYHMKFLHEVGDDGKKHIINVSDHVCNPRAIRRREAKLRHEWDDPEVYCECDELDCKFEYLDILMNEME